jgi:hypothetical protein
VIRAGRPPRGNIESRGESRIRGDSSADFKEPPLSTHAVVARRIFTSEVSRGGDLETLNAVVSPLCGCLHPCFLAPDHCPPVRGDPMSSSGAVAVSLGPTPARGRERRRRDLALDLSRDPFAPRVPSSRTPCTSLGHSARPHRRPAMSLENDRAISRQVRELRVPSESPTSLG